MKLEAIEQSKFDAGRCVLVLSNGERVKSFLSVVVDMSLYVGMELDSSELCLLRNSSRSMSAKARAARIVGAAPVSKKQLVRKLKDKGEDENDAQNAADWLEELGAINDEEYAVSLAKSYAARGYGKARIKQKLKEKEIDRDYWDNALAAVGECDEQIDKYISTHLPMGCTDRKIIKKVSDALIRRGFSWSEISAALGRNLEYRTAEEED